VSTIGVAIAVPEPFGGELQRYRASFGDPQAGAIPTHVTLVPPTEVGDQVAVVAEHLSEVGKRHMPFHLRLRGTATFRPLSPVVFVNVTEGISSCELLAADVRRGPLTQRLAFPFHPHVTVAHGIDEALLDRAYEELADYDCAFDIDAFHLYMRGDDDGIWRPRTTFVLEGCEAPHFS
jgi:2'-5' RNA ligase